MTTVDCDLCTAPVHDMGRVCSRCAAPLITDLRDVPALDAELDVTVFRLAKMTAGNTGGGHATETPVPYNATADDTGRALKAVLASWCALVSDKRGVPGPLDGLAPMSRWLIEHVTWLRHHEAGPDAVTEIRDAVRAVRRAIDRPRDRRYSGQCDGCGSALYASERASQAVCPVCVGPEGERTTYSVQERRDAMLSAMAVLCMAPPEASYALSILVRPIPANTIRVWAKRGKLLPAGVDDKGHSIYRLADIAALMLPEQQAS
ncbi:MerR family transcriptional regulator [Nonomuraea gerenzanensis]|uniref:Uncharacterized protein n=1 Tax=Nonomuraea gerenzanensis TaxID=93944 RepID=A0A1M4EMP0_9ACTN|nr:hypothetical protein [Nonomuraea gerenzanensis]UBU11615.1 hypothetical protein LCN96_46135 [Nonomuraea gerenzanensis]SBP00109.1 hypothetical protein BN4615_P9625 [Nonomuraea gerenzanensis]